MAFITAERTREIKKELKQKFPQLNFTVRNEHHSSVAITIVSGSIDFSDILEDRDSSYMQLNQYYLDRYGKHEELLKAIYRVVNQGNYDNSDIMTDYFDVGFYVHMSIGSWDKPYELKEAK